MKPKYQNFKHWAAGTPEPTHVPEQLIRKHWSIQLVELYQLVLFIGFSIYIYNYFSTFKILQATLITIVLLGLFAGLFLSISDNHRYRPITVVTHLLLITYCTIYVKWLLYWPIGFLSLSIIATLFIPEKNRNYYKWCKSIS